MITQRLKVEKDQAGNPTGNIIKDDGSLFTAFGHNYDNPRNQIIEDSWNKELYAGGFKGANHIAKISNYRQVDAGTINFGGTSVQIYEITLTTDGNHNFMPNDKMVLSNVNSTYEKAQPFDLNGYIADTSTPRITSVSSDNLTIKYSIGWPVASVPSDIPALNNVTTSVTGLIVAPSTIESDLAILNLNGSNIIRICLQLDKFMTDKNTSNQNQLNKLYEFCDLAAKYDIYVIINGANTWVSANQPDWLTAITEEDRWLTQANFWKAIANKVGGHPAVAWYSLINEPIDQYDDAVISAYSSASGIEMHITQTDDGLFDSYSVFASRTGKPGYALMSNGLGIELIKYQNLQIISDPLNTDVDTVYVANLVGITRSAYGNNTTINDVDIVGSYISLIDKKPDLANLQVTNVNALQSTALIDLAPNNSFQPFQIQTNQYQNKFGFVGSDYAAATKAASNINWGGDDSLGANIPVGASTKTNRYSTQLSLAVGLTEVNHAISGSILSSNIDFYGVPFGYGQVLNARGQGALSDYTNGNTFKINSVNFGTNDFLSYGTPYGYNTQFFTHSLRTILSRLRSSTVTEFTGLSGFSEVPLSSASGGSYQQYSGANPKVVTFSTGSGFIGGTIAIGFMVENNANAKVNITVNDKYYNQSLISGTDTRPGITAPIVKRIPNLPAGNNTITITFTITSGSACLDYWQIESNDPAPIIVHNIAELQPAPVTIASSPTASGTTYTYTTSTNHNLFPGESVTINGITAGTNFSNFNGTFTVVSTPSLTQFTVTGPASNPTATAISGAQVIPNYQVSAIRNWNQEIANLISTEFFDGTVLYFDVNNSSVLNTGAYVSSPNTNISSDYLNPNDVGHTKISAGCKNLLDANGVGAINGVSVTGTSYTYITVVEHGLNVGDLVVIKNATPSTSNGIFTVNAITTKTFTVTGVANPVGLSAANASYAQCLVQPNTTYFISTTNSSNIPSSSKVAFTTASIVGETNLFGQSKIDSNLRYQIALSNASGVNATSSSENCLIVDNTQWLRGPYNGTDRHYSPYLTLTPKSRSKFTIARQWINQIKSAININDVNTPVTFGTIYADANGGVGSGFSIDNTYDLLDILSPHQYVGGVFGYQTIDDNVSTFATCYNYYNKPVFLEEGGIPQGGAYIDGFVTSPRTVVNYLLRSKKYLAGVLNNYQAKGVWVTDPFNSNYQVAFDLLKPFMNDAPSNDSGTDPTDGSTFGQSTPFLSLNSTNIPKRKGRRYLVPSIDKNRIQSSAKAISGSSDCLPKGTYKYIVTAVVNGKELPAYPSAQCTVNISSDNKYYAQITWSLPLDEYSLAQIDSYRIYRYSDSSSQYSLIGLSDASFLDNIYIDNDYSNSSNGYYHGYLFSDLAKAMTTNTTRIYIKDNQNQFFLDSGGCRIGTQDLAYSAKTYESSSNTWYLTISNHTGSDNSHSANANVYPTFSQFTDNKGLIDFSPNVYTYVGFLPIPIDPLAPSNFYGVDIDASYIAQTHLTKSNSATSPTFAQMSSMYYNGTEPLGSEIILNLNSVNISPNQTINTLKTVTNLKINQYQPINKSFFTNNWFSNWSVTSPYTISNIFSDTSGPNNGVYYPNAPASEASFASSATSSATSQCSYLFPPTTIPSGSDLAAINIYAYVRVSGTQKLNFKLVNYTFSNSGTTSTTIDTLSQYRGNWIGPSGSGQTARAYVTGDIVYYNGNLWQCPSTYSPNNTHTPQSPYWNQLSSSTTPSLVSSTSSSTNYAWIKWTITSNMTDITSLSNLAIFASNTNTGSYSYIAKMYAEIMQNGNANITGTEAMQVKLFRSQDVISNQDQSGARILVNNNLTPTTNQWLSSGQHTWSIPTVTGTSSFPINWGTTGYDSNNVLFQNWLDVYDLASEPQQGQYVSGPGIASGTTVFFGAYVNTQDNGLYHYKILLSNATTSDQSLNNVTLTFTDGDPRALLDGLELHFRPNDGTTYSSGNNLNNLNLYTSYVEIKLTETLSRVGTPIATII